MLNISIALTTDDQKTLFKNFNFICFYIGIYVKTKSQHEYSLLDIHSK